MKALWCWCRGIVIAILLSLNAILLPCTVLFLSIMRLLIPLSRWRYVCDKINQVTLPPIWVAINKAILKLNTSLHWDIEGVGDDKLAADAWYFLISNHRGYADILVIDYAFSGKIPKIKFFMKRQLLWLLPFVGLACRAMGYPFLYRATKRQIKKNPALKGRDVASIKDACKTCARWPTALLNFLEGTRFTLEKQTKLSSPYQHLLPPNTLGFALPLQALADLKPSIINITLVYPGVVSPSLWKLISGQIKQVVVRYEVLPFDPSLQGDALNDRRFRLHFRQFVNRLWSEKEVLIQSLIDQHSDKPKGR